jgi:hypothetical protein
MEQEIQVQEPPIEAVMSEVIKSFTTPEEIEALEGELLGIEPIFCQVKHYFSKGLYAREIEIPAGTIAIGNAHTEECLNVVVAGAVFVVLDGKVVEVRAGETFTSPPLTRKIGYITETLRWMTVHPTNDTCIERLEEDLIIKSQTAKRFELLSGTSSNAIVNCKSDGLWEDRLDYFNAIKELGFSHADVRAMSESDTDQIPVISESVYVASSRLNGNGIFAAFDIQAGTNLGAARIGPKRTRLGRYTNHAKRPNCISVPDDNGDIFLHAIMPIKKGEEATLDYRQARASAILADSALNLNTQ